MTNLDSVLKSRDNFSDKGPDAQSYGFSSSHVWIWELDHRAGWVPKNWCFQTVVLEETLESPLDCKEIKPVNLTGNWSWIFIRRTDAKAETPVLWPPDAKNWLIGKDPDAGKDWRQEEKGTTEDEMVGWHHWPKDMSLSKLLETVKDRVAGMLQSMGWQKFRHDLSTELNWTHTGRCVCARVYTHTGIHTQVHTCT